MSFPSPKPNRFPSQPPEEGGDTGVRRREVFFQSGSDVEARVRDRRALVDGAILTVVSTGARFVLRDAMRILGAERGVDVFGMTGRIIAMSELLAMGAILSATALRIGTVKYDVQPGYLVQSI
jgi:hypothetical protein